MRVEDEEVVLSPLMSHEPHSLNSLRCAQKESAEKR